MIKITEAFIEDIAKIQEIANITWPITYGEILTTEQLDYMLNLIYSDEALSKQIQNKEQLFYLISDSESIIGFIGIEHNYKNTAVTKIHKIYLLPETQGKGYGKIVFETIEKLASENNSKELLLNVNRFNAALNFYKKLGFEIKETVDIEIGNGYLMEDYVMGKNI
ncbi:GNAT family N-acetyltransferase [Flavobacterium sp. LC2016-01]|uniref:GNAT family N-acetyltransferase n=1 Tax=Flavobacterium sp. LC2016-01 TaxID=2675876 RepID=UPI0012BA62A0|nr:GNAT family N-acetyltransferase [Flavobacterium sp. LC2016-01]MTH14629.1 GNAT family N-acetyltransferase [Flavobacterium sp. LC2016-01]